MIQRAFIKIQVTIVNSNNRMILRIVSTDDTCKHVAPSDLILIYNFFQSDRFFF